MKPKNPLSAGNGIGEGPAPRPARRSLVALASILSACSAVGFSCSANSLRQADVGPFSPDFFPIMPWDPQHRWCEPFVDRKNGLESIAECCFTVAGFVQPKDLPLCEKLGLAAIMAPAGASEPWFGNWREMSDEEIDEHVRAMVERAGRSKAIAGFFIMDEPGTPVFPKLAEAVAAVRKYAPGKLAYINLYPSYATAGAPDLSQLGAANYTEYLERFVSEVNPQFLSYDNYMVQYSDDLRNAALAAIYFSDLVEIRRAAQKHGLPFWNIVASCQIKPGAVPPSPANLLLQAWTTLAAGGRGVTWYMYYADPIAGVNLAHAPVNSQDERTPTWGYLQMVNRQLREIGPLMNRLTSTGVYFHSAHFGKDLPLLPGKIVNDVESRASSGDAASAGLPVMVGEFQGPAGDEWIVLVNLSLEKSAWIQFATHKGYRRRLVALSRTAREELDGETGLWLVPGGGALIELQ